MRPRGEASNTLLPNRTTVEGWERENQFEKVYFLGNEMAYTAKKSNRTFFTIGDELQTEADFKRQIESRFGNRYATAWKESLAIVHKYPKEVLLSQNHFFNQVYRPRRDELASKWTETTGG